MKIRIYIGNLPFKAENQDIIKLFSNYGNIVEAEVIRYRKSRRSKGYGFVIMEEEDALKAIEELHKSEYKKRILKVKEAKERSNFPSFSPSSLDTLEKTPSKVHEEEALS